MAIKENIFSFVILLFGGFSAVFRLIFSASSFSFSLSLTGDDERTKNIIFQNTETPCLSPLKFVCWLLLALSFSFRMLKFCFLIIQIVLDKSRKFIHLRCDNFCWKLYKINAWHRLIITKCNISIELINVENSVENVQNFAPNGYIYYVFYVENLKYADVSTFYT